MDVLSWPEILVEVYALNWVPDFNWETAIPQCQKSGNGGETLVT